MVNPVWGQLAKAQNDDQTIDDAIDAAIGVHEADPSAHLGAGESLQTHKSDEVIDHPADSVVDDKYLDYSIQENKLIRNKLAIDTNWETIDAYYQNIPAGGAINNEVGSLFIKTSKVSGKYTELRGETSHIGGRISDGDPVFETTIQLNSITSQNIFIGIGWQDDNFLGFYIDAATLYACKRPDQTSHNTSIQTLAQYTRYNLRVVVTSGVKTEFFVNGTLVHTDTTYTPDFSDSEAFFTFYVKTTSADYRSIVAFRTTYYQSL